MTRAPHFFPRSNSWQVSRVMPPHRAAGTRPRICVLSTPALEGPCVTVCKDRTTATHGPGGNSLANTWSQEVVRSLGTFPSWRNQGSEDT